MAAAQVLHVGDTFNPEEAAHVAGEFVASLDNLSGEVSFLLEEIREKDVRINQLLNRINVRHGALTKHARTSITSGNNNSSGTGSTTPPFPLPLPPGSALPTAHLSAKDAQAINKIITEFAKVHALQDEKIALAERMERIVGRARERGRAEWVKVGGIDLEEVERMSGPLSGLGVGLGAGVGGGMGMGMGMGVGIGEMGGGEVVLPSTGLGSGMDRPTKKKKLNAPSLPLSTSSPMTVHPPPLTSMPPPPPPSGPGPGRPGRRRAERHVSTSTMSELEPEPDADGEADADAEGEADGDAGMEGEGDEYMDYDAGDGEDGGDESLYCVCRQKSYGEMVGCDNDACPYEWFHVKCVNITGPLPETWFCPDCVATLGLSGSDGRTAGDKKKRKARS